MHARTRCLACRAILCKFGICLGLQLAGVVRSGGQHVKHGRAGEKVDMPVFFYIDPEFATDARLRGVDQLTLSYTFFKVCGPHFSTLTTLLWIHS